MLKLKRRKVMVGGDAEEDCGRLPVPLLGNIGEKERDLTVCKEEDMLQGEHKLQQDFGAQLRKLRKRLGMSLEELEDKTGISSSSLSLYERGKGNPTLQSIQLLAQSLQVPVHVLLGERPGLETELCHAQLLLECMDLISTQSPRKQTGDDLFLRALKSTILLSGIETQEEKS